jgi:hypothetical protein
VVSWISWDVYIKDGVGKIFCYRAQQDSLLMAKR